MLELHNIILKKFLIFEYLILYIFVNNINLNKMKSYEEFRKECLAVAKNRSQHLRKGQAIFNYVDEKYDVAREAQFVHKVDCFYLDEKIEEFIKCTYSILRDLND